MKPANEILPEWVTRAIAGFCAVEMPEAGIGNAIVAGATMQAR
ncbi:hypothetical protein LMG7141_00955 [Ralstonia condita]|uniref:Uncharacterized protein n=1 Tax=Ralstonia condita TaxID=3058600 RepID=A0ABN9IEF0_9RALS|nr:hypothetical protein LMG7141_00955 [Ralstonia sp. LMG 7141]